MALTSPDNIPYIGPTQYSEAADFPAIDEDQALALQSLITSLKNSISAITSNATGAAICPVGTIVAYGGTAAPTGWHLCNGTAHGSAALTTVLGSANAPDLRDRFVVGAGLGYVRNAVGGTATNTLTASQSGVPVHSHTASSAVANTDHYHGGTTVGVNRNAAHSHTTYIREGNAEAGDSETWIDTANGAQTSPETYRRSMVGIDATNTDHEHGFVTGWQSGYVGNYVHNHTITVDPNAGASAASAIENRPPFYALTYIIKK